MKQSVSIRISEQRCNCPLGHPQKSKIAEYIFGVTIVDAVQRNKDFVVNNTFAFDLAVPRDSRDTEVQE